MLAVEEYPSVNLARSLERVRDITVVGSRSGKFPDSLGWLLTGDSGFELNLIEAVSTDTHVATNHAHLELPNLESPYRGALGVVSRLA